MLDHWLLLIVSNNFVGWDGNREIQKISKSYDVSSVFLYGPNFATLQRPISSKRPSPQTAVWNQNFQKQSSTAGNPGPYGLWPSPLSTVCPLSILNIMYDVYLMITPFARIVMFNCYRVLCSKWAPYYVHVHTWRAQAWPVRQAKCVPIDQTKTRVRIQATSQCPTTRTAVKIQD